MPSEANCAPLGELVPSPGLQFLVYTMGLLGKITASLYIIPPNYL